MELDTSHTISENQRIKLQRRKENNPFLPWKKLERFSLGMVVKDHLHLVAQLRQIEMRQDKGLQADKQVFVGWKNEVVGELDFAVEILAATFGIELDNIVR